MGSDDMARIIDGERMNLIGACVEKRRKELKMSQQALSNKLELLGVYVCRGSISRIEDYSRTVTDIELYAIAKALHVTFDDLFSNYDEYLDLL
jgi:transcriptional regulator with XRE-family HTH domain